MGVVAEGAVVKNKTVVESNCIFAGVPAKQIGQIDEDYKNLWSKFKGIYVELSRTYRDRLKKIS
jgi:carbonic anhydrase/acetyltransferase-like protein (isoleucine patch superfamily)